MVVLLVSLATVWHDRKEAEAPLSLLSFLFFNSARLPPHEARSSRPSSSSAKRDITMDDAVGFLDGLWAVKKPQGPPQAE